MQKIALPVLDNKLSPHFGICSHFKFYWEENGEIIKEDLIAVPGHQPDVITGWLIGEGITDVIASGIELSIIEILNRHKVNVFVGVKLTDPCIVVREFLEGTLETNGKL
jgi:predicted Fe-Mo cluster-binding NifX family protein